MGGLAWASVPFYDWFCRVTGFGGTTGISTVAPDDVLEQTIKVRFDASLHSDMDWDFKPEVHEMELRIGETGLAFMRHIIQRIALLPDKPAITLHRTKPAISLIKSTASALKSRCYNRVKPL